MSYSEQLFSCDAEDWVAEPGRAGRVLVAEDQYVIALDLSKALERSGLAVLGPVATLDAALSTLRRHDDVAGAVLDVTLRGTAVGPLAEALRRRGVPFVFFTGHRRDRVAPTLRDVPWCEKPLPAAKVVEALCAEMVKGQPDSGPPMARPGTATFAAANISRPSNSTR